MAKILIVEDDAELRQIYRSALEREDLDVYEAADGQAALDMFVEIAPDIMLLDMMMPRLSGEDVLIQLRDNPAAQNTRLVVITAYPQFREQALSYGVDQFLTKPVKPSEIVHAVLAALKN